MKKITYLLGVILITLILNGCKKLSSDNNNSLIEERFFTTTTKTKPIVQRVIKELKAKKTLGNLDSYVAKYGFPNWDKVIINSVASKSSLRYDSSSDSTASDSLILIPTIMPNETSVNGFIAIETTNPDIFAESFIKSDYDRFPYESSNPNGIMSADEFVTTMMRLEKEVNNITMFNIEDPLLSMYKSPVLPNDIIGVGIYTEGRDIYTYPNPPDDGCSYWAWFKQLANGDWIQIGPWQVSLGSCPAVGHLDIKYSTLTGADDGGLGGGGYAGYGENKAKQCGNNYNWQTVGNAYYTQFTGMGLTLVNSGGGMIGFTYGSPCVSLPKSSVYTTAQACAAWNAAWNSAVDQTLWDINHGGALGDWILRQNMTNYIRQYLQSNYPGATMNPNGCSNITAISRPVYCQ